MYAIKVSKTNRYISYYDDCWYETTNNPLYLYTYEEAKAAATILKNHYIYRVELIHNDGTIEIVDAFHKNVNPMKEIKKSITKIKIRL